MAQITQILSRIEAGDSSATDELLPLVYDELRKLAAQRLAHEKPGQTLQATALVHEAYLRLLGSADQDQNWNSHGHFFGAAAEAMRRILVDNARRKASAKHGGERRRIKLDEQVVIEDELSSNLIALDEALCELEQHDSQAAQLVKLRYFAGLSHQQAAEALKISRRAADRLWIVAKAWLFRRISE